jgi:hypothetical protein
VRLRQVELVRESPEGRRRRAALAAQSELLSGCDGVPGLVALHEEGQSLTVVATQPVGPTWHDAFRPGDARLDRLGAGAALAAMIPVCAALGRLHRAGHAHRALGTDGILLTGRHRHGALRDVGLAGFPPEPGEGPDGYRAPEQRHTVNAGRPGPWTDVYQIAAILCHTITGLPVGVARGLSMFPDDLGAALAQALDVDPRRRPDMDALTAALRTGRRSLAGPTGGDQ